MNNCKQCKEQFIGNYCPNCGHPAELKRIDKHYVIKELSDFLFAYRGMIYTIKELLLRPGNSIRRYITEDRSRFVKPITFLFMTALIYTLAINVFHIELISSYEQETEGMERIILKWLVDNAGYRYIIVGLVVSFWAKIFFRKEGFNLFEIFTLYCFVFGISTLIHSVAVILQGITHLKVTHISIIIGAIYIIWALGQFFDSKKISSYFKALLSFILGLFTFGFAVEFGFASFAIIETLIRHKY